ncbi:uncharacterized protein J4E79_008640 [Alternaria viburni]|uniref:uncharacterized protein n=1 Tax=Alternaria viburni TaxID=566460 RepID=UPI0020C34B64|nr:uncharacterized protein J4E79_008640 [Alternaria viburni]KAI4653127.1 hypothetical protein J4E79_008640 [Alternaria viburni]
MASHLPDDPDAIERLLEPLRAQREVSRLRREEIDQRLDNCTSDQRFAELLEKENLPSRHEQRKRVRTFVKTHRLGVTTDPAATISHQHTDARQGSEVPKLQGHQDPSRRTVPKKSAGKRQASAEDVLRSRSKRPSRRSEESDCPFASDAEPESYVPTIAPSKLRAKEYPIAILLPVQGGRNVVIRNGIPDRLTTLLRNEVKKWLTNDLCIRAWNDADSERNAACMLITAEKLIVSDNLPKGQEPTRACRNCSTSVEDGGLYDPRPCAMLRADAKGEYILVLPLPEDLREGKGWKERGFWVNETPRAPFPRFDALRA